jgi:Bacteriophage head to tail connecting protein
VAVAGMERFAQSIGQIAAFAPGILDKLNADQYADVLADKLGVDPQLLVADKQVALIRRQRAEQQAQDRQLAMLAQGADVAGKLGGVSTLPGTAAGDLLQSM